MKRVIICLTALLFIPIPAAVAMESWNTPRVDDFEGSDFSPSGGLYYRRNFEQSAGSVEFQSDVTFKGNGALKLSVKPLCPEARKNCSERAEIWEKTDQRVPYNQESGTGSQFGSPILFPVLTTVTLLRSGNVRSSRAPRAISARFWRSG